ncbi:unnamed protein product, partial [Polarella glacialis]
VWQLKARVLSAERVIRQLALSAQAHDVLELWDGGLPAHQVDEAPLAEPSS